MIESWRVELVTPPVLEPLTFAELVDHLREDPETPQRQVLERLIIAARAEIERRCGIALLEQTRRLWLDSFPWSADGEICLPFSPVSSVSSIKYLDQNGDLQTLASGNESPALDPDYLVNTISFPARIMPAYGKFWPATRSQVNAVQIEYVCGFGDRPEDVPEAIRLQMSRLVGHWYENRESTAPGDALPKEVDDQLQAVIMDYRISHFA